MRKMLSDLGLHAPDFSGTYTTERGNAYDCFNLPNFTASIKRVRVLGPKFTHPASRHTLPRLRRWPIMYA